MACRAAGHGTIRLHELAIPSTIERRTAALIAWYIPKSSLFTMSTRASGAKPSNALDRAEGAAAGGPPASSAMRPSVIVARGNLQPLRRARPIVAPRQDRSPGTRPGRLPPHFHRDDAQRSGRFGPGPSPALLSLAADAGVFASLGGQDVGVAGVGVAQPPTPPTANGPC